MGRTHDETLINICKKKTMVEEAKGREVSIKFSQDYSNNCHNDDEKNSKL